MFVVTNGSMIYYIQDDENNLQDTVSRNVKSDRNFITMILESSNVSFESYVGIVKTLAIFKFLTT